MREIEQSLFINQLENEVENQLKEVLEVFQNLPESTLLQPSLTGGWSITECFEHLNTYYNFYLPKLNKALAQSSFVSNQEFKHSWLGNYFIKMMDIEQGKKKYKAIKKHWPIEINEPHKVLSEFIQHTESLTGLLRLSHSRNLAKIYIATSISRFINMNSGDAFKFLSTHNRRHIVQAKRNLDQ